MINAYAVCNICGWSGTFLIPERQREGMVCRNCSSSSRHRAVVHALGLLLDREQPPLFEWPPDRSVSILESSARGPYPVMLADKFEYYATEYDPAMIAAGKAPREFADFQRLHYGDATFRFVIASDVFEHIRKDEDGYREVLRVLKPGGALILTVPYNHEQATTVKRVDTSGDTDVHILEPEYHGGGGHTLTYRNYGRDLLALLNCTGFSVVHLNMEIPARGITRQSVILGFKGEAADLHLGMALQVATKSFGMLLPYRMFLFVKYNMQGFLQYWKQVKRS